MENQALSDGVSASLQFGLILENIRRMFLLSKFMYIVPDSRRAVVSFWRKNVHNTGLPLRGLSLPSKRVVK